MNKNKVEPYRVEYECMGEHDTQTFYDYDEAWSAYAGGSHAVLQNRNGYCHLYHNEKAIAWTFA